MKKLVLGLGVMLFGMSSVFAYTPTASDAVLVEVITGLMQDLDDDQTMQVKGILESAVERFDYETKKGRYAELLLRVLNNQGGNVVANTATVTTNTTGTTSTTGAPVGNNDIIAVPNDDDMELVLPTISPGDYAILQNQVHAGVLDKEIALIEFTDLQCPFCHRFHKAGTLEQVARDYDSIEQASLAFPLSFHPLAHGAAQTLECVKKYAGDDMALVYKDVLIASALEVESDITESVEQLGLNSQILDQVVMCSEDGEMSETIDEQFELGKKLGVTGTPATIVIHIPTMQYFKIAGAVNGSRIEEVVDAMLTDDWEYFDVPKVAPTNPGAGGAVRGTGYVDVDEDKYADFLKSSVVVGNTDAQYTILEFSDFACPFCQRHFMNGTIESVLDEYPGQVNTAFGHFPLSFHQHAQTAGEALECAKEIGGEEGYLNFKAALFEVGGNSDEDKVEEAAIQANLSVSTIADCVDSGRHSQVVKDQMAFGRSLGVTGTPGNVLIDNETLRSIKISGAVPVDAFTNTLDQLIDGSFVYRNSPGAAAQAPAKPELNQEEYDIFLNSTTIKGNPDAEISVIEFSDIACPFCQRHVNSGTLDAVHEKYGDDVNIIFAHYPLDFHPHANTAAQAVECAKDLAGEQGYFAFKTAFFDLGGNARPELAAEAAEIVGIDPAALTTCVDSGRYEQKVEDDKVFGSSLGVRGTPGNLVVNNTTLEYEIIPGAVGADAFDARIEELME